MDRKVVSVTPKNEKPRVRFCHDCGKQLYGNHHAIVKFDGIDHEFIYHKDCAENLKPKEDWHYSEVR